MSKKKRRQFTNEQKARILRRHMVDKVAVSDLCEEYKIQPSVFYGWQRQLVDNLAAALEATSGKHGRQVATRERELTRKVKSLEARLAKKEHVIAEISEEYVTLKKELGGL